MEHGRPLGDEVRPWVCAIVRSQVFTSELLLVVLLPSHRDALGSVTTVPCARSVQIVKPLVPSFDFKFSASDDV